VCRVPPAHLARLAQTWHSAGFTSKLTIKAGSIDKIGPKMIDFSLKKGAILNSNKFAFVAGEVPVNSYSTGD
jgi:hypothetical protein